MAAIPVIVKIRAAAEPLYKRSPLIWEKALGPEHPNVATSLVHPGGIPAPIRRASEFPG